MHFGGRKFRDCRECREILKTFSILRNQKRQPVGRFNMPPRAGARTPEGRREDGRDSAGSAPKEPAGAETMELVRPTTNSCRLTIGRHSKHVAAGEALKKGGEIGSRGKILP